jgi:hypothetical protein
MLPSWAFAAPVDLTNVVRQVVVPVLRVWARRDPTSLLIQRFVRYWGS